MRACGTEGFAVGTRARRQTVWSWWRPLVRPETLRVASDEAAAEGVAEAGFALTQAACGTAGEWGSGLRRGCGAGWGARRKGNGRLVRGGCPPGKEIRKLCETMPDHGKESLTYADQRPTLERKTSSCARPGPGAERKTSSCARLPRETERFSSTSDLHWAAQVGIFLSGSSPRPAQLPEFLSSSVCRPHNSGFFFPAASYGPHNSGFSFPPLAPAAHNSRFSFPVAPCDL